MTYPAGRYHFGAVPQLWHSGKTLGPSRNPTTPVSIARACMAGSVLTSPGSSAPTTQFVAFTAGTVRPNYAPKDGGITNIGNRLPFSQMTQVGTPGGDTQYVLSAGMNVSGLIIWGEVYVTGKATMRDCIVYGPKFAAYDAGLIRGQSRNLQASLFEWIIADGSGRESPWTDGVKGGNFTMRYSVITRTNDGMGWSAPVGNGVLECCRIVDGLYTAWYNSATGQPYSLPTGPYPSSPSDMRSHPDCIQIQGRSGWVIDGCYLGGQPVDGWSTSTIQANRDPQIPAQKAYQQTIDSGTDYENSCVLFQNNLGAAYPVGALLRRTWLAGGAASINLNGTLNNDTLAGVTIQDCWIIPDARGRTKGGIKIYMSDNCQATVTGVRWADDNSLVTINLYNGGTRAQAA